MERYICIHGHFYQPPRENPWLEAIELQDSAYPYHDWNERITAECYAANAVSRILDGDDRIVRIVNNYSRISFNFGPTLLVWLEENAPEVYRAILAADRESQQRFSGHGSAMAQAYNHIILPLAHARDKYTQIVWGIRDFQRRFCRAPEGMWLPEAAVDLETLEILAARGIRFTLLAPSQAARVRRIGEKHWHDAAGGRIDPTMAYRVALPSGRDIAAFFYDGPISRGVAFEKLLTRGENLAHRLTGAFSGSRTWPQLVHIATDGETYGHHHRHGDMALAYALHYIESNGLARLTNYGEYLERHPPTHEAQIIENSAWSCAHGVERWRSDCGCNTGMHPGWNQQWRGPLREALDWLRDRLAPQYQEQARSYLREPWAARDDYIGVILDRSPETLARFFEKHAARALDAADRCAALKLLELQRNAMLMYTSCGWFFDELSGIETVQIIQYAARALQLAQECFGDHLEDGFMERMERAKSNIPAFRDGRWVYEKFAKPAMVNLEKVGAHYAISSLFESYPDRAAIYCYTVDREDSKSATAGQARLVVGLARIVSTVTQEAATLGFGALHFGDHNLHAGARAFENEEAYRAFSSELADAFGKAHFPDVIRLLDKHFGASTYSLKSLFRDEQRKILDRILESSLADAEAVYRQLYRHHAPLMRFLADLAVPLPKAFRTAAEFVLNTDLRRAFRQEVPDIEQIRDLLEQVRLWRVELDAPGLAYQLRKMIDRLAEQFHADPSDQSALERLEQAVGVAPALPAEVSLWRAQNLYYDLLENVYPDYRGKAEGGDESARAWVALFSALGDKLRIRVPNAQNG